MRDAMLFINETVNMPPISVLYENKNAIKPFLEEHKLSANEIVNDNVYSPKIHNR